MKSELKRSSKYLMDFKITPPKLKMKQRSSTLLSVLKSLNQYGGIGFITKVVLIILVSGVTTYAYYIEFYEIFCIFLFVTGVITGTFFSDISTWWNFRTRKNLPYVTFTKDSPKPTKPVFLDLRRKSFNVPNRASDFLPLKQHPSSPVKQLSKTLNFPIQEEIIFPMSTDTTTSTNTPIILGYPTSSSSSESDVADAPQQQMDNNQTKRRVIPACNISFSPLIKSAEISTFSKRRLEFEKNDDLGKLQPLDISYLPTPKSVYSNCKTEDFLSQNFSFFET